MLTPNLLQYLIEAPSVTQALKTLRFAEHTGYPTDRDRLPALMAAMFAHERRKYARAPILVRDELPDWRSGGAA